MTARLLRSPKPDTQTEVDGILPPSSNIRSLMSTARSCGSFVVRNSRLAILVLYSAALAFSEVNNPLPPSPPPPRPAPETI